MSTILKRAHHVLLIAVATVFGLTLLSPIAALASTDLVAGQQAIVDNPDGSGANLRSDITVLDESTLITELSQGSTVSLIDGPMVVDNGTWFWVSTTDGLDGFVSTSLLRAAESAPAESAPAEAATDPTEEPAAEEAVVEQPVSPDLLWQEPTDTGFVVDDNNEIPAEGLACRATATVDGEVLARIPLNATLQVAGSRIWQGDVSFVHVNCGDGAGYVNGKYVVLQSEQTPVVEEPVVEEPVVEVPVIEEPVVEVPVIEVPVVEVPVIEVPIVEVPVVEVPVIEVPVVKVPVIEEPVVEEPVVEETTTDEVASTDTTTESIPAETEEIVVTEETVDTDTSTTPDVVESDSTTDETVVEEVVDAETEAPVVADVASPEATDDPVVAEDVTEEVATDDVPVVEASPEASEDGTEPVDVEPVETEVVPVVVASPEVTEIVTEEATEPVETEEAAETAESEAAAPQPLAATAPASDVSQMIGTATVTGTNGEGLRCRVGPSDDAATLMVLEEGTKVYVLSEATNGYLGIDCGGLQGFADVNFLWSGGAGDEDIQNSNMTIVVTGTGNGLNCRTGASTGSGVITVLRDGDKIQTRGAASDGWVPVTCAGQNGFVATTYVEPGSSSGSTSGTNNGTSSGTATVSGTNGDGLYCRSGAGSSYSVITVLSPGQSVPVRGANQGSWTPVTCGGAAGWASAEYLTAGSGSGTSTPAPAPGASTGTVTVANTGGTGLNCRTGAGTSSSVITVLRAGQSVSTRSGSTSGWQAVVCGGQNGFVSSEFVTGGSTSTPSPEPEEPSGNTGQTATVSGTNGDGLYCRSGAGSGNSVITVLSPGQSVPVRGAASNGWLPITCGGTAGWASADYLTIGSGSTTPTDPKPSEPAPSPSGLQSGDHAQTTDTLNLRYEPSMGAGVAAAAPAGTVVLVTSGASNGFYGVDWDGLKGYMSGDYLTETSAALTERGGSANPAPTNPPGGGSTATGNAMVDYAMGYLGYPYVWATAGPASFDCSGFTYWVAKNVLGVDIGRGTWTQVSAGTRISRDSLQPGDLVFHQNTYTAGLSHVGIYIGNNKMINALNENAGVVISDITSDYWESRWYGAVRL